MKKVIAAAALAVSVFVLPVGAAPPLQAWDTDASGVLDEAEFRRGVREAGLLEKWDEDGDELLGPDELAEGLYDAWDADDDGALSVSEWDTAVDLWFGESDVDLAVEAWDDDGNGAISPAEFEVALEETALFARFDEDEDDLLAVEELADGIFDVADADDELGVDEDEWGLLDVFDEDDGIFGDEPPGELEAEPAGAGAPDELDLIEEGRSFVQLPIPCGSDEGEDAECASTAERFCAALGYEPPIDHLARDGALYAIRCRDEP